AMSRQRADILDGVLGVRARDLRRWRPFVLGVVDPVGGRYPPLAPSPTQQRRRSRGGSAGGRSSAGSGWRDGPSATAACACSNAVLNAALRTFLADPLRAAGGGRERAAEGGGGWRAARRA